MRIFALRSLSALVIASGLWPPLLAQPAAPGPDRLLEIGQRIYTQGLLTDGKPLQGLRFGNMSGQGAEVACVACHRPSGLGQVEGGVSVPPIAGNFLYAKPGDKFLVNMDPQISKLFNQVHEPYTEATLNDAIVKGVNNRGQTMSDAMPRYTLGGTDLQALSVYLKQLSADWSPGVDNGKIRFASVITPDVGPDLRKTVKDMLQLIVRQKNGSTHPAQERRTRHHMTTAAEMILGTERKWELDIWELQGAPETWAVQLEERYRAQPVFALLSGVSLGTWQPVHDFCDRNMVPCWFPSVVLPVQRQSPYAFYFSGGVVLEAQALAKHWLTQRSPPARVLQIYRDDVVGRSATAALSEALQASGIQVSSSVLRPELPAAEALRTALAEGSANTQLMMWLRPDDVAALQTLPPVGEAQYFSGLLGKGERAPVPTNWRAKGHLVYPYALPDDRTSHLIYFHAWRNLRKIPLVDEALQSEVFFAMNFMTDTVSDMLENFHRDYLLERGENMVSRREGGKAEQEVRDRIALGSPGELEKKHGPHKLDASIRVPLKSSMPEKQGKGTTMYPGLSLGPGQRFASKGAYIVGFAEPVGEALRLESDWIVP